MDRSPLPRRRLAFAWLLCLLLVALGAAAAVPAAAAPTEPTLTVEQLRAMIAADADGKLPGHFETVLSGTTITNIPCNVLAVADGELWDNTPLIMFEATGPDIDRIGGIAAGMSGSPLFVDDGGIDKLVGAVSYGYWYTTNGLGLATPIELMAATEDKWQAGTDGAAAIRLPSQPVTTLALPEPVRTRSLGTIDSVTLARTQAQASELQAAGGTAVMAPLMVVQIGGLDPQSRAYKHLAASLRNKGIVVCDAAGGGVDPDFETPLFRGAAVGAVLGYGDYWLAAMGTVTYVHDNVVVAFGHPLEDAGVTELIMANCKVHGVWSDLERPFKLMSLGKMRGAIVRDRSYCIMGTVGSVPELIDITATATLEPSGRTASAETLVPAHYPYVDWVASEIAWGNGFMPVQALVDGDPAALSADTTLHVVVNDGSQDLELTRNNMERSIWGIGDDAYMVIDTLLSNPNGTAPATLKTVDSTATVRFEYRQARILDAQVTEPLHIGDNTVVTTIRRYGQVATETRDVTLTIPADVSTQGRLAVSGGSGGWSMYTNDSSYNSVTSAAPRAIEPPATVADIIADINEWPQNNDLQVTFYPQQYDPDPDGDGKSVYPETIFHTTEVLSSGLSKRTPNMVLGAAPRTIRPGRRTMLAGFVFTRGDPGAVAMYRVRHGVRTLLGPVTTQNSHGIIVFSRRSPHLRRTTRFLAVWSGNEHCLAGQAFCTVRVRR
jgi:hypothetical protein